MPHALVTGCLGGYGVAICKVLKRHGYTVIGTARREGDSGADHHVLLDLRDLQHAQKRAAPAVEEIRSLTGRGLELLVNNAAYQVVKDIDELGVDDMAETLTTNVMAPFLLVKHFLSELESAGGSVVNVASIHANLTKPGFVAYATSKGALVTMTKALAVELGGRGIRVNAVLPAATETPMLRAGFEGNPEGFAQLESMHPLGRIASPEEIAEVIAFLGSDHAGFMSGSTVEIDGGIGGRLHDPV